MAALVGVALLFGGLTQLAVATRVQSWRWLVIVAGILGVAAGILTFVWPAITLYVVAILVAWYLIVFGVMHLVGALAGPSRRSSRTSSCSSCPTRSWSSPGQSTP